MFDRYEPVSGAIPTRPRSDHNPLNREEYLLRFSQHFVRNHERRNPVSEPTREEREALPIPDRPYDGPVYEDAKDPDGDVPADRAAAAAGRVRRTS